jgi:DNA-binding PadR family transcriptional regulator
MQTSVTCCGETCELPRFLDLRGLLSFWLLWELRLGPLIGAQLSERLEWRRGAAVSPGTLYPALAELEKAKLVQKKRDGRETQYRITPQGSAELSCAATYLRILFSDVKADAPIKIKPAKAG